ncbi:hypothetical protein ACHQM5_020141 [Ranunculus cassubicifolius]
MGIRATWTPELHQLFIYLCLEQVTKGNRPGSHINKEGYKLLVEEFYKRSGQAYDKAQLKNHWDSTKEQWKYFNDLRNLGGSGWDDELKTFTSGPDFWKDWFSKYPKCHDFRKEGLKFADECDYLFGGTTATGNFQFAPSSGSLRNFSQGPVREPTPDESNDNTPDAVPETQQKSSEDGDGVAADPIEAARRKVSKFKKRRRLSGATRLNNSIERLIDVVERRKATNTSQANQVKEYSITECIEILNNDPTIPIGSELYMVAMECFLNKDKREIFMAIPIEVRNQWLETQKRD